ncbi:MAG: hypothetical protein ACJAZB_001715 [Psychrosphaera sp.]|jgi:hypothetical protein
MSKTSNFEVTKLRCLALFKAKMSIAINFKIKGDVF